jgi:hypothetical protein
MGAGLLVLGSDADAAPVVTVTVAATEGKSTLAVVGLIEPSERGDTADDDPEDKMQ